ncbi:MAG: PQQ-binding-like beta-propeller repeat protein [Verrucomicrobiales bacterium]|nr:PQQ-binding-like beta-propeller repeat protein [Verrucomicrobiales bacterium]
MTPSPAPRRVPAPPTRRGLHRVLPRGFALATACLLSAQFALQAADVQTQDPQNWAEFRGPHRSGALEGTRFPSAFGPGTNQSWSVAVPGGHSSPSISGSTLVVTGFESNRLVTLALDRHSGATRWRAEIPPGKIESGSRLSHPATATATAASDGERWVSYFAPFGLVAYAPDGRELWRHPLPTPITQHGASSSPVIAGGLVLQLCDQDIDSYLLAVDLRTGERRWRVERPGVRRSFSTPLPWPAHNPELVVVAGTLGLVAYDLADGSERWRVRGLPNEMVASPVADDAAIYVAGWTSGAGVPSLPAWTDLLTPGDQDQDGRLSRDEAPPGPAKQHFTYLDADKDGFITETEYTSIARIFQESRNTALAVKPGGRGDITDSHVLWRAQRGLPYVPTPLAYQGLLYLVRNGGLASCLDARTGEYCYQEERLGALGDYYSSPVAAGDRILVISQPGTAVVYRAGRTLEVLSRVPLGEEVLATPALAEDTLYIRTKTRMIAYHDPPP